MDTLVPCYKLLLQEHADEHGAPCLRRNSVEPETAASLAETQRRAQRLRRGPLACTNAAARHGRVRAAPHDSTSRHAMAPPGASRSPTSGRDSR